MYSIHSLYPILSFKYKTVYIEYIEGEVGREFQGRLSDRCKVSLLWAMWMVIIEKSRTEGCLADVFALGRQIVCAASTQVGTFIKKQKR